MGITGRECKLLFVWSRMLQVDPLTTPKGWARGACTYVEFLETIARTADMLSLPTPQDLSGGGYASCVEFFKVG